jgi:hypothetical protein
MYALHQQHPENSGCQQEDQSYMSENAGDAVDLHREDGGVVADTRRNYLSFSQR